MFPVSCVPREEDRTGLQLGHLLAPHPRSSLCWHKMGFLVALGTSVVTEGQGLPGVWTGWPGSSFCLWDRSFSTAVAVVVGGWVEG